MRLNYRKHRWFGVVLGVVLSWGSAPAWAATITVQSTGDSGGCPGACTLRDAIATAMAGDTIDFTVTGAILLTTGELLVVKNLTITGPGANQLAVDGNNASRVMQLTTGITVAISGLTIRNGRSNGAFGGGIENRGTLTVSSSTFSDNSAVNGHGGGIFNGGTLTVSSSTFSGNSADFGGGIENRGTLTVSSSTFSDNSAFFPNDRGGGAINVAHLTMTVSSTIFANSPMGGNCSTTNFASLGDNISSDATCVRINVGLNDRNDTNPLLNALANNGGPTQTFALQNTSPAINEVRINTGTCSGTDQRGVARPIGPRCDIGAVESSDATPVELQEFVVE